jgi:hypothetical protein
MALPTDRGYVAITDLDDGGKRVEIYARKKPSGPTHLFAAYQRCRDVVLETDTPFDPWEAGSIVSDDVVEVSYSEEDGRLYVREPADMSDAMRSTTGPQENAAGDRPGWRWT